MNKKIFAVILVLVTFVMCISANAQWVDNNVMRIEYDLPDSWHCTAYENESNIYKHSVNNYQYISICTLDAPYAFSYEAASQEELDVIKNSVNTTGIFSDEIIKESYRKVNNITSYITLTTSYVNWTEEVYNGVKYLAGEKSYVLKTSGFYDAYGFTKILLTFKNGKGYLFAYESLHSKANYNDFINLVSNVYYDKISISVNGQLIYPDTEPVSISGRTMVPIRAVAEALGYNVTWNGDTQVVSLIKKDNTKMINLAIGDRTMLVNLVNKIELDVPPLAINGRTYLPLRAVAEAMNTNVNWNSQAYRAEITSK